jgi:hypothetical protein
LIAPPGPQPLTIRGAVLDAQAGQWSTVLPAQPAAVTGAGNIICAGQTALFHTGVEATALSFDSRARNWQTAAPPPFGTGVVEGELWTGRETVVFGEGGPVGYEPAADRWRRLSPSPLPRPNTGVWAADRAVLVDFDAGAQRLNLSAYLPKDG